MIRAEAVKYSVGQFELGLDLEIAEGDYFVLIGPTGSGKTAILECVAGLRDILSGTITLAGGDATIAEPRDRDIGYVPQDRALFGHLTVRENIAFSHRVAGMPDSESKASVNEITELLGISHLLDRAIRGLSGGEAQRVALARALAAKPKLLLLDEPVSALDEETRDGILADLRRLQRIGPTTTLHVCHSLSEMRRVADRIGILRNGRIVQTGTPEEVRKDPADAAVARSLRLGSILRGIASPRGEGSAVDVGGFVIDSCDKAEGPVEVLVRAGSVAISKRDGEGDPPPGLEGARVKSVFWSEASAEVELDVSGAIIRAAISRPEAESLWLVEDCIVSATVPPEAVKLFAVSGE